MDNNRINRPKYMTLGYLVDGQNIVLIGGGVIALGKARTLTRHRAYVTVVAPEICPELRTMANDEGWCLVQRQADTRDCAHAQLVIIATNDHHVNRALAEHCRAERIPVNVVDDRSASTAIMPAIVQRGLTTLAIASDGQAPTLVSWLRGKIESMLPEHTAQFSQITARWRPYINRRLPEIGERQQFWRDIYANHQTHLPTARLIWRRLNQQPPDRPVVQVVCAAANQAERLTLAALGALQSADLLIHSAHIDPAILELARRDSQRRALSDATVLTPELLEQFGIAIANTAVNIVRICSGYGSLCSQTHPDDLVTTNDQRLHYRRVPGCHHAQR